MHGSIRDQLENLLADGNPAADSTGAAAHLANCSKCLGELRSMQATGEYLRKLRVTEEIEPGAGFYAKVLQKIEQRGRISVWAEFLYSPFSKRLVYASLSAALILGAYVVAEESVDGHLQAGPAVAVQTSAAQTRAAVVGSQSEQRDAVLVNFASYEGPSQ